MSAIVQSFFPKIEFYHENKSIYKTFSVQDNNADSSALTSYGYRKSVHDFSGNFSITITENNDNFIGNVLPLDIVRIFNSDKNENPDFIGIITNVTYTSRANGSRISTITGRDIAYLFEFFTISFDSVAMSCVNKFADATSTNLAFKFTLNNSDKNVQILDAIKNAYSYFVEIANNNGELSNTSIQNEISLWFGDDFVEVPDNVSFLLPISSNIFGMTLANFPEYIRNLLPDNVYEFFSVIKDGNPILICREKPFDLSDDTANKAWVESWSKLAITKIDPMYLTDYTLTRSIDEIYTAFLPYVEGATQSADFYAKIASLNGYQGVKINQEKRNKYGFKFLQTNFIGFNTENADNNSAIDTVSKNMGNLSERMNNWYGRNDEFYNADINCVYNGNVAKVGERLSFLGGEFYVTDEEITWRYGSSPTVKYACERGAVYNGDTVTPLNNFSKKLSEVML